MAEAFLPPGATPGKVTYRQLAEHIKSLVLNGTLSPGSRLPAVRQLASRLQISNLTVHRAYSELARAGFTSAATSRGTQIAEQPSRKTSFQLLAKLPEIGPFNTFEHVSEVAGLRSMATALPDPGLLDTGELLAEVSDLRTASKWMWGYAPTTGEPELVQQITRLLASQQIRASGHEIVVTMGEIHAISLLAQVLFEGGDRVLVQDPHALLLSDALIMQGVEPVPCSFGMRGLDLDFVRDACANNGIAGVLITPAYSNPTGLHLPFNQAKELLDLAERHEFYIIEIGSYRLLGYDEAPPPALASSNSSKVIYIDTFSYTLAPALRVGYMRAPDHLTPQFSKYIQLTMVCPPPILQRAVANYISSGRFKRHLTRVVPKYRARRDALLAAVEQHLPMAEATPAKGGFSTWIRLPDGFDTEELLPPAVSRGVAFTPGTLLSQAPSAKNHLRLAHCLLSPDAIHEAVKILGQVVTSRVK